MTLELVLHRYIQLRITGLICKGINEEYPKVEQQMKQEMVNLFNQIDKNFKLLTEETSDSMTACCFFLEMSQCKLGENLSILLTYYHATKAMQQSEISKDNRMIARRCRLSVLAKNLDRFDSLISLAETPMGMGKYNGTLKSQEFFDFLIMSDTYLIWDLDESDSWLQEIKELTKQHEPNHPRFSKRSIIEEGTKAHNALYNVVSHVISLTKNKYV